MFLPQEDDRRRACEDVIEAVIAEEGLELLGWRDVPVDPEAIGDLARSSMPTIRQVFIGRPAGIADQDAFERKLYIARKVIQNRLWHVQEHQDLYPCSFSSRTIVYKGLLLAPQIEPFYGDLGDERFVSALALVHQRYSTNTWPTWDLAQPFRVLCHNGEINTLRGNGNWMRAREAIMRSDLFGDQLQKLFPIIREGASDSNQLDNALEFSLLSGRDLPHAMMMLIPEAWDRDPLISDDKKTGAAAFSMASSMLTPSKLATNPFNRASSTLTPAASSTFFTLASSTFCPALWRSRAAYMYSMLSYLLLSLSFDSLGLTVCFCQDIFYKFWREYSAFKADRFC